MLKVNLEESPFDITMTAIDILKRDLIGWLSIQSDPEVLQKFNALKEQVETDTDWWDELTDVEKSKIERGLQGKSNTFEEVREHIKQQHGI